MLSLLYSTRQSCFSSTDFFWGTVEVGRMQRCWSWQGAMVYLGSKRVQQKSTSWPSWLLIFTQMTQLLKNLSEGLGHGQKDHHSSERKTSSLIWGMMLTKMCWSSLMKMKKKSLTWWRQLPSAEFSWQNKTWMMSWWKQGQSLHPKKNRKQSLKLKHRTSKAQRGRNLKRRNRPRGLRKKRKLTGAEIAKRAKRLAIVDEVPNEPVDAMQIVLLEPEQSNHTAVVPPEQPAQVSQPQGVVPNSNEQSKDPVFPEQPAQGTVPKETVPTSASAIDDSMSLYDLLYDSTERASSSTSRPPPAERASSSGSRPPPECASGPPPTSRNDESSKAGKAPELREKRANTTTASGKRGPIADRKEPIQWTTVKCEKCKKDAGQWKYDPSPGQRDAATYYYRVHETDKKHSALASLAKVFEELIWNRQGKFCLKD